MVASVRTRVLIGYDGSTGAEAAMDDLSMAGLPPEAEALVVSVAETGSYGPDATLAPAKDGVPARPLREVAASRRIVAAAALQAERTAAEGADRLRRLMPGWRVTHAGLHGAAYRVLVDEAQNWGADLLVVGSHGRSPIGRLLLGSVSHFVAEHAGCSVRVGRGHQEKPSRDGAGIRILVGVDGSDGASAALNEVLRRVWPDGSEVRLVVVVDLNLCTRIGHEGSLGWLIGGMHGVEWPDWPRRLLEPAAAAVSAAGLRVSSVVLAGDSKRTLPDEAARWGADAIFVGAAGRPQGDRFLLGSVSCAVASRSLCSVEVVRPQRRESRARPTEAAETAAPSALRTREVVEQEWPAFADQFSRLHKGQLVTVETFAADLGAQVNGRDVPLVGITVEHAVGGACRLVIAAGDSPENQFAHVVDRPAKVRVAEWNDSVSSALQIESADGTVTLAQVGPAEQLLAPGFITDGILLPPSAVKHRAGA